MLTLRTVTLLERSSSDNGESGMGQKSQEGGCTSLNTGLTEACGMSNWSIKIDG